MQMAELEFIGFNHRPECSAWVDKFFPYYVIQYAESGELDLFIDDRPVIKLHGPVVWLTFPGPYFKFGRRDDGCWNHRFVSFKGPLSDTYAQNGMFPSAKEVIKISEPGKFTAAFDQLLERLSLSTEPDFRTVHMLEEIMLQLAEQPTIRYEEPSAVTEIRRIAAAIEINPTGEWNWPQTAKDTGVSYPHFRKLFHDTFKMPPAHFLLLKKLEKSAVMLRSSDKKIDEIAERCEFYDMFHYAKIFKKYYGTTPGQYRKNHTLK